MPREKKRFFVVYAKRKYPITLRALYSKVSRTECFVSNRYTIHMANWIQKSTTYLCSFLTMSQKVLNFGKLFLPPPPILGDAGMTLMSTGAADSPPFSKSSENVDPNVARNIIFQFLEFAKRTKTDESQKVLWLSSSQKRA